MTKEDFLKIEGFLNDAPVFLLGKNDQSQIYFSGIYFYGKGEFEKAESYFTKVKSSKDSGIKYNALKYLVEIYIQNPADTSKVELLIDEIDTLEDERLAFRAKELEEIYKLD